MRRIALAAVCGLTLLGYRPCSAAEPNAAEPSEGEKIFALEVRPILREKCFGCHSADADEIKGGFNLDSRQIYVLSNDQAYGVPKGTALHGAAEEDATRVITGIKFPKKQGHRDSVIYVFPRFVDPDYEIIPYPPVAFNPPSRYGRNLSVEIGVEANGKYHGQFIKNTTGR